MTGKNLRTPLVTCALVIALIIAELLRNFGPSTATLQRELDKVEDIQHLPMEHVAKIFFDAITVLGLQRDAGKLLVQLSMNMDSMKFAGEEEEEPGEHVSVCAVRCCYPGQS